MSMSFLSFVKAVVCEVTLATCQRPRHSGSETLERFFRGTGGLLLLHRFSAEDAQNHQAILDLLERIEDNLPIASHSGVISCAG
jgi:hypothetical protein